jgi:RHS repeat-associated protein
MATDYRFIRFEWMIVRQYVHGPILDEVLLRDELLPDYVASLVAKCNSDGMYSNLVDSLVECKPDTPGGFTWPPIGAGASDSCGPCSYEIMGELLELDVWVLSGVTADCSVCIQPITTLIPYVEGGPTPSCVTCYTIGLHLLTGTPPEFIGAQASECQPCGPEVLAWYAAPNGNPAAQATADFDCIPCEAWDGVTFTVPPGGGSNPPVCGVNLAGRIYYHQNEQQSVFAVTNATGVVLEGYAFDPYGATIVFKPGANGVVDYGGDDVVAGNDASSLSVWTYTGRRYDAESGLLYYRTRYLDSEMGRFISRDTIGVWGDPNSLGNAYTYLGNGPQMDTDPFGLCKWWNILCKAAMAAVNAIGEIGVIVWECLGWTGVAAAGVGIIVTILTGGTATVVMVGLFVDLGSEMLLCLIDKLAPESQIGLVITAALMVVNPEKLLAKGIDDVVEQGGKLVKRVSGAADACKNSFTAETLVLMADGSWQPIEYVLEGDYVWAHDPETGEAGPREVVGLIRGNGVKDLVTFTVNGDTLTATSGHPFWVNGRGWIDAGDVRVGDTFLQGDGGVSVVETVESYSLWTTAYNFEVAELHTYLVEVDGEGVLVHNCSIVDWKKVKDHELKRKFDQFYKHVGESGVPGMGTTADFIRAEGKGGKHWEKGEGLVRGLQDWIQRQRGSGDPLDLHLAEETLRDLQHAMKGL